MEVRRAKIFERKAELAEAAREWVAAQHLDADRALERKWEAHLSVRLDPASLREISMAEETAAVAAAEAEREYHWAKVGDRWTRRAIVREWEGKRGGKKVTVRSGAIREEVAFTGHPVYSRALFLACEGGDGELARKMAVAYTSAFTGHLSRLTGGAVLLSSPLHAKINNLHLQPSYSLWSAPKPRPDGRGKEGLLACLPQGGASVKNRMLRFVGRSVVGKLRQARLGLDVDALTGVKGSAEIARKCVGKASENQTPVDLLVSRWGDRWFFRAFNSPEFEPLRKYLDAADADYRERKNQQIRWAEEHDPERAGRRAKEAEAKLASTEADARVREASLRNSAIEADVAWREKLATAESEAFQDGKEAGRNEVIEIAKKNQSLAARLTEQLSEAEQKVSMAERKAKKQMLEAARDLVAPTIADIGQAIASVKRGERARPAHAKWLDVAPDGRLVLKATIKAMVELLVDDPSVGKYARIVRDLDDAVRGVVRGQHAQNVVQFQPQREPQPEEKRQAGPERT